MPTTSDPVKRAAFPNMLTEIGLLGTGAEIGVLTGDHSVVLLENWPGEKLICVDPYGDGGIFPNEFPEKQHIWEDRYKQAMKRLNKYGKRCELWKTDSQTAARIVDNGSLDWVYLDGRHSYEGVSEDIHLWRPKIKKGGIIGGHDYLHHPALRQWPGVRIAVDDAFEDKVQVMDTGDIKTWYVHL